MAPILELAAVTKRFGAVVVADQLDLHLAAGEALGVIGPNGAGKTSMLNIIAGELRADRGQVFFEGREITALPPFQRCQRGIARSYQIPHPFAGMTAFENLLVGATFGPGRREREVERRCVSILEQTGLLAKANRPAGSLTLLERKQLELARALAIGPRLLLLDEIAGGLGERECQELIGTIRRVRAGGVSIIWIEHIVHALLAIVDRLIVIHFGKKIADGEPKAVMQTPAVHEIYLGIALEAV
jgi:branched-chain amino acid transport system ATP-binding protein